MKGLVHTSFLSHLRRHGVLLAVGKPDEIAIPVAPLPILIFRRHRFPYVKSASMLGCRCPRTSSTLPDIEQVQSKRQRQ